jgi:hypothetical protein
LVRSACLFLFCVVASASTLKFAVSNNCLKHGDSVVMNVCVLNVCDSLVCFSEVWLLIECILILIVECKQMSSLLVKERSELAMISSSQTASESMRRSASFISLRLLANFHPLLMKVTLTTLQDSKLWDNEEK